MFALSCITLSLEVLALEISILYKEKVLSLEAYVIVKNTFSQFLNQLFAIGQAFPPPSCYSNSAQSIKKLFKHLNWFYIKQFSFLVHPTCKTFFLQYSYQLTADFFDCKAAELLAWMWHTSHLV
jgi:hypothetical protein